MIWLALLLAIVALVAAAPLTSAVIPPRVGFYAYVVSLIGQIYALPMTVIAAVLAWLTHGAATIVFALAALLSAFVHWRNRHAGRLLLDAMELTGTRIPLFAGLNPLSTGGANVRRIKDLAYGDAGERNLLDLVMPRTAPVASMPILIHVHGGGWSMGGKGQQAKPLLHHLAAHGWLCVDINYRFIPGDRMPAMIVDVLRVIAWVKAHANEHGGDPTRVAISGGSAGGHLAALAALAHDDPAFKPGFEAADCSLEAAIPVYGIYDLLSRNDALLGKPDPNVAGYFATQVMPGPPESCVELWHALSPLDRLRRDAPPMLVIHGTGDTLQPVRNARAFAEALRAVSAAPVRFVELPGIEHAYDVAATALGWAHARAIEAFLAPLAKPATSDAKPLSSTIAATA